MITDKLYDNDAYISEFSAIVLSQTKTEKGYEVILDKTAFFPEAGGQPCDTGTVDGKKVLDVRIKDEKIVHLLHESVEKKTVNCKIDFERRFSFMQNHSGEHIVSGIVNKLYGFENVGFHLNEEFVTLDFNGILSREQIEEVELLANEVVWQNKNVKAYYPTENELKSISFRQKKEIQGDIRLVEIEDTDICACCAPHIKKTGEIGMIKLLSTEKMRGGIRILMKCGRYALLDYNDKFSNITKIQNLLSVKPEETAKAVFALEQKTNEYKLEISGLKRNLITLIAETKQENENLIFAENFDNKQILELADSLYKKYGNTKTVLTNKNDNEYLFVMCGNEDETNALFEKIKTELSARGGGRGGVISGTINASKEDIIKAF